MKREFLRLEIIRGNSAEEFQQKFNSKMRELADQEPQVEWRHDLGFAAYISYIETEDRIESIREEFHAEGIRYTCGCCPLHDDVEDKRHKVVGCRYAELGECHLDHEACEFFYAQVKAHLVEPIRSGYEVRQSWRKEHYREIRGRRRGDE